MTAPEPVRPMHTLAAEIEVGPASREMSDWFLLAVGWTAGTAHFRWANPAGEPVGYDALPDPTQCLDDIAAIERESGAEVTAWVGPSVSRAKVYLSADWVTVSHGRAAGDHAEARSRCAALCRALAARTPTGQP